MYEIIEIIALIFIIPIILIMVISILCGIAYTIDDLIYYIKESKRK